MEVLVFDTKDLPEGCILSIRAGNTRRQAPLPLTEPFRFPNLPFNARHFKVDVLSTRGSGRLEINAGKDEESYFIPVQLSEGVEAKVGLTVREQPSLCGKRAAELKQLDRSLRVESAPEPSVSAVSAVGSPREKASKVARDTREYARDHNLHNLVQEMLQYVLRERPDAPYSFMSAYLRRKAEERGEKFQASDLMLKPLGKEAGAPAMMDEARGMPEADAAGEAGANMDPERVRLEAEHVALRMERAQLLRELVQLEGAALAAR